MGMSTHVTAFISDKDETYQKHAKVLMACHEAGINVLPKETAKYFGYKYPEPSALEEKLTTKLTIYEYHDEGAEGYEIIVSEIPEGVYKIRFTNSW